MLTREKVEATLLNPRQFGDPSGDSGCYRAWYGSLSQAERSLLHDVLASWLRSSDEDKMHVALWFVAFVEPVRGLGPLVAALAPWCDARVREGSYLDQLYVGFVRAAVNLKLTELTPYLTRWAEGISDRSRHWSWTALGAIIALMELDRAVALAYAPRIVQSVIQFPPEPTSVNTVLGQFIHAYVLTNPDHLRELGMALSPVDPSLKSLIEARFRESVSHFVSTRWRTEEWAGEARRQFAEGLTGQPAS